MISLSNYIHTNHDGYHDFTRDTDDEYIDGCGCCYLLWFGYVGHELELTVPEYDPEIVLEYQEEMQFQNSLK
jgi:hypothetical protein